MHTAERSLTRSRSRSAVSLIKGPRATWGLRMSEGKVTYEGFEKRLMDLMPKSYRLDVAAECLAF